MATRFLTVNEHPIERLVRVGFGLALLALVFVGPRTLWGLVGVLPIITGASGRCPFYAMLGMSTCASRHQS